MIQITKHENKESDDIVETYENIQDPGQIIKGIQEIQLMKHAKLLGMNNNPGRKSQVLREITEEESMKSGTITPKIEDQEPEKCESFENSHSPIRRKINSNKLLSTSSADLLKTELEIKMTKSERQKLRTLKRSQTLSTAKLNQSVSKFSSPQKSQRPNIKPIVKKKPIQEQDYVKWRNLYKELSTNKIGITICSLPTIKPSKSSKINSVSQAKADLSSALKHPIHESQIVNTSTERNVNIADDLMENILGNDSFGK